MNKCDASFIQEQPESYSLTQEEMLQLFDLVVRRGELHLLQCVLEHYDVPREDVIGALYNASASGRLGLVECILTYYRGITQEDIEGAFIEGASQGQLQVVEYLVERGVDVHAHNESALDRASENGHFDMVRYLVEHGAHAYQDEEVVEITSRIAHSPKLLSILKTINRPLDPLEVKVIVLAAAFPDHKKRDNRRGLKIIEALLKRGDVLSHQDVDVLIETGHVPYLKLLEKYGWWDDMEEVQEAFEAAVCAGSFEMVQYLIERGADTSTIALL